MSHPGSDGLMRRPPRSLQSGRQAEQNRQAVRVDERRAKRGEEARAATREHTHEEVNKVRDCLSLQTSRVNPALNVRGEDIYRSATPAAKERIVASLAYFSPNSTHERAPHITINRIVDLEEETALSPASAAFAAAGGGPGYLLDALLAWAPADASSASSSSSSSSSSSTPARATPPPVVLRTTIACLDAMAAFMVAPDTKPFGVELAKLSRMCAIYLANNETLLPTCNLVLTLIDCHVHVLPRLFTAELEAALSGALMRAPSMHFAGNDDSAPGDIDISNDDTTTVCTMIEVALSVIHQALRMPPNMRPLPPRTIVEAPPAPPPTSAAGAAAAAAAAIDASTPTTVEYEQPSEGVRISSTTGGAVARVNDPRDAPLANQPPSEWPGITASGAVVIATAAMRASRLVYNGGFGGTRIRCLRAIRFVQRTVPRSMWAAIAEAAVAQGRLHVDVMLAWREQRAVGDSLRAGVALGVLASLCNTPSATAVVYEAFREAGTKAFDSILTAINNDIDTYAEMPIGQLMAAWARTQSASPPPSAEEFARAVARSATPIAEEKTAPPLGLFLNVYAYPIMARRITHHPDMTAAVFAVATSMPAGVFAYYANNERAVTWVAQGILSYNGNMVRYLTICHRVAQAATSREAIDTWLGYVPGLRDMAASSERTATATEQSCASLGSRLRLPSGAPGAVPDADRARATGLLNHSMDMAVMHREVSRSLRALIGVIESRRTAPSSGGAAEGAAVQTGAV